MGVLYAPLYKVYKLPAWATTIFYRVLGKKEEKD